VSKSTSLAFELKRGCLRKVREEAENSFTSRYRPFLLGIKLFHTFRPPILDHLHLGDLYISFSYLSVSISCARSLEPRLSPIHAGDTVEYQVMNLNIQSSSPRGPAIESLFGTHLYPFLQTQRQMRIHEFTDLFIPLLELPWCIGQSHWI